jgi:hypothetical protein
MQPITWSRFLRDYPALLKITGRCGTRPPKADSSSPRAIPVIFALLGCVKWQIKNFFKTKTKNLYPSFF